MVMELTYFGMETATKENLKKGRQTAKANTLGQMVRYMSVNSGMDSNMVKAGGNQLEK